MNRKMRANLNNKTARIQKERKPSSKIANCGKRDEELPSIIVVMVGCNGALPEKTLH